MKCTFSAEREGNMLAFELAEKNKKEAVIQCLKLLNQRNLDVIKDNGDGTFLHTNMRGKTRKFLPCMSFKEYEKKQKEFPYAKFHKCIGYYVLYWNE